MKTDAKTVHINRAERVRRLLEWRGCEMVAGGRFERCPNIVTIAA